MSNINLVKNPAPCEECLHLECSNHTNFCRRRSINLPNNSHGSYIKGSKYPEWGGKCFEAIDPSKYNE
ncbi:MAG: hypothetical protein ACRBBN_13300 [Methyloligellaceae bacterium]